MPYDRGARYAVPLAVAWSGAAVFALSLLWGAYSYAVRFGSVEPTRPTGAAIAWNAALLSAFAFHHSLFARAGLKAAIARVAPAGLERSIYTWVASLLFMAVCRWWQPLGVMLYEIGTPWRALAYAVQLGGVVMTIISSARLDPLDLAGVRQVEQARDGTPPRHVALETAGVYGFVRHPLYFAWLLMVFAAPSMTGTRFCFAVLTSAYLAMAIPWEERSLVRLFGPDYEAYRRQVRWRMLPGVY